MAEPCGQQRELAVDVGSGAMPGDEPVHRQGVPQIVGPGPATSAVSFQSHASDQGTEVVVHGLGAQARSSSRDEEARRLWVRPSTVSGVDVATERFDGGVVQRQLPGLFELAPTDGEQPVVEVHIGPVEAGGLHPGERRLPP